MRTAEAVGKTVKDATRQALAQLDIDFERVDVEILTEPATGLFGLIGSKQARVRVTEKITAESYLQDFLQGIMNYMDLTGEITVDAGKENIKMNVTGARMGMLIGKRGQTLNSLQYLLNVVYHRHFPGQNRRVVLDVEDYREKREETLRILARNLAKKATRYRKEVVLEPMSPLERRIIHSALQEEPSVSTHSQGEDPYRKVVIVPNR